MDSKDCLHTVQVVSSSPEQVGRICKQLLADASANGFDADDIFAIHLALEEATLNAVRHGNKDDAGKKISVDWKITDERLDVSIADEGCGFDPSGLADCRVDENLYKCCGRGVLLMRSYMDTVEYNQRGNCVHMVKFKCVSRADADKAGAHCAKENSEELNASDD